MNPAAIPNPTAQGTPVGTPSHPPAPSDIRDLALKAFGTPRAADFWMDRPNPELGGATPNQIISGGRAQVVKDFLEGLIAGNFG